MDRKTKICMLYTIKDKIFKSYELQKRSGSNLNKWGLFQFFFSGGGGTEIETETETEKEKYYLKKWRKNK